MNLIPQIDPLYLFAAGCAVATWVLLRRAARLRSASRGAADHLHRLDRPVGQSGSAGGNMAAMTEQQQVEIHDLVREANGRLDNKMILLQQLLAQSQRQIDRLEALLQDQDRHEPASPPR